MGGQSILRGCHMHTLNILNAGWLGGKTSKLNTHTWKSITTHLLVTDGTIACSSLSEHPSKPLVKLYRVSLCGSARDDTSPTIPGDFCIFCINNSRLPSDHFLLRLNYVPREQTYWKQSSAGGGGSGRRSRRPLSIGPRTRHRSGLFFHVSQKNNASTVFDYPLALKTDRCPELAHPIGLARTPFP